MKPSANQSKPIIYGLRPPVLSLSFCDRPVCIGNNALFNWILFGGNSNADRVMKDLEDLCLLNPLNLCMLCDSATHWSKTQSYEKKCPL